MPGPNAESMRHNPRFRSAKACEILKAHARFADQTDGEAVVDQAHYDAFRRLLEAENPDIVFTQWPIDNHRDHRATSTFVYDAWLHMKKRLALYYYEVSAVKTRCCFIRPTTWISAKPKPANGPPVTLTHRSRPIASILCNHRSHASVESKAAMPQAEAFIRHPSSAKLLP